MLVKALIEILEKCKPNANVYICRNEACYSRLEWVENNLETRQIWFHYAQPIGAKIRVIYVETSVESATNMSDLVEYTPNPTDTEF
jgi:hypothetical protein